MHVFWQILGAVFVKWTFFYFSKMYKMKNRQRIYNDLFFGIQFLEFMQYIFVKNMHTHYHIQFEFFMFFLGFFLFPNISMQSFYIMNINKHYHIQFEFFMFFLGFFYFQIFHAVILHNEYK